MKRHPFIYQFIPLNHYPRHIGDYLRDTGHLSLLEHGVYSRLLDLYYLNNGPLHLTVDDVIRKLGARSPEEREAVDRILREFFTLSSGVWSHKRADQEIERFRAKSESARANAHRSHAVRSQKDSASNASAHKPSNASAQKNHADARKNHADALLTNNQEPITNNQEPITNNQEPCNPPPAPRKRGKAAGAAPQAEVDWFSEIPAELDLPEFRGRWLEWVEYRRMVIKKPVNPLTVRHAFSIISRMGVVEFMLKSENAMANGWEGFNHDIKTNQTVQRNDHRSEKRSREFNEKLSVRDVKFDGDRAEGAGAKESGAPGQGI
jgi:uncharacterized protein YdaU (DUF1376 family)